MRFARRNRCANRGMHRRKALKQVFALGLSSSGLVPRLLNWNHTYETKSHPGSETAHSEKRGGRSHGSRVGCNGGRPGGSRGWRNPGHSRGNRGGTRYSTLCNKSEDLRRSSAGQTCRNHQGSDQKRHLSEEEPIPFPSLLASEAEFKVMIRVGR